MNMEVMHGENQTSLAYSANKLTVAMYPICIEFKAADGTFTKGAITFLSEDKEHSHQQIQQFEHRMFELIREKLHRPVNHWNRYSDGCGAQLLQTCYVQQKITRWKVYHSIILNHMKVKAFW